MRHSPIRRFHLIVLTFTMALASTVSCAAMTERGTNERSADGDLLRAVHARSIEAIDDALQRGGDPNRIFGRSYNEWAMCAATRKGSEFILAKLLANGGNPSLVNPPASSSVECPLTCSMIRGNRKAHGISVKVGAGLTVESCIDCAPGARHSLIFSASGTGRFDIARELLDVLTPTEADIRALTFVVEKTHTLVGSPNARYTLEFVEYLADPGIAATPPCPME